MEFEFTEEHRMARQMVRDFAQKEIYPTIKELSLIHISEPTTPY